MMESQASQSDAELLALVGAGDVAAFKSLITRYHGTFMAMALSNSISHADCEEAVGDAFLKIWSSASKYEDFGIDPKYWLRTLMRHALLDKLRTLKRFHLEQSASKTDAEGDFVSDDYGNSEDTTSGVFATPVDALETKQANACFDECLQALSDAHRDTLQRSLIAGQAESFIAVETAQSLGTVKSRKHYAVKKMQTCVSDCLAGSHPTAPAVQVTSKSQ
jgi:RNA polymerase sigma-70 factor, ECF subfamily